MRQRLRTGSMCVTRDEERSEERTRGAEMSKKNKNPTQRMWGNRQPKTITRRHTQAVTVKRGPVDTPATVFK